MPRTKVAVTIHSEMTTSWDTQELKRHLRLALEQMAQGDIKLYSLNHNARIELEVIGEVRDVETSQTPMDSRAMPEEEVAGELVDEEYPESMRKLAVDVRPQGDNTPNDMGGDDGVFCRYCPMPNGKHTEFCVNKGDE